MQVQPSRWTFLFYINILRNQSCGTVFYIETRTIKAMYFVVKDILMFTVGCYFRQRLLLRV